MTLLVNRNLSILQPVLPFRNSSPSRLQEQDGRFIIELNSKFFSTALQSRATPGTRAGTYTSARINKHDKTPSQRHIQQKHQRAGPFSSFNKHVLVRSSGIAQRPATEVACSKDIDRTGSQPLGDIDLQEGISTPEGNHHLILL